MLARVWIIKARIVDAIACHFHRFPPFIVVDISPSAIRRFSSSSTSETRVSGLATCSPPASLRCCDRDTVTRMPDVFLAELFTPLPEIVYASATNAVLVGDSRSRPRRDLARPVPQSRCHHEAEMTADRFQPSATTVSVNMSLLDPILTSMNSAPHHEQLRSDRHCCDVGARGRGAQCARGRYTGRTDHR